tara:strand:+ start:169 stop:282 length:114 start_codon:yes stop_codon:yes gene_type:complete
MTDSEMKSEDVDGMLSYSGNDQIIPQEAICARVTGME